MADTPQYFKEPLNQPKMGTAILAACIVRTLNESDPTFQAKFLENLGSAYSEVRDSSSIDVLEMLAWTREILKTQNYRPGENRP